ncbi:MAG: hypothetical protein V1907_03410 [Candidatus Kerfeldbacteria bacterium]
MPNNIPTEQKVTTKPKVLVAIVGVLALAAAAAFAILPTILNEKSGTTEVAKGSAKPLKVVDVTQASSEINLQGTFFALTYKAGIKIVYSQPDLVGSPEALSPINPEAALSITRTDSLSAANGHSLIHDLLAPNTAHAQGTPYSIGDLPMTGLPTQMILIAYRGSKDTADKTLNVCIGETSAQKVYVATDGSTYTDSGLTHRTTVEPCETLTARTFAPTKIIGGKVIAEPSTVSYGQMWEFDRYYNTLAYFTRSKGYDPTKFTPNPEVTEPSKSPMRGAYVFTNNLVLDPTNPITDESPAALFRIDSQTNGIASSMTLCFPRVSPNQPNHQMIFYFDNKGTPYRDILLSDRAMTTSCPELITKSFAPETVTKANTSPVLPGTDELGYFTIWVVNRGKEIGVTNGTLWQTIDNGPSRNIVHPMVLVLGGAMDGNQPVTIPSVNVSITDGAGKVSKLCFAGANNVTKSTVLSWQLQYYYDSSLKPYKDMFLTEPVSCTPQSSGGSGTTPVRIPDDDIGTSPL